MCDRGLFYVDVRVLLCVSLSLLSIPVINGVNNSPDIDRALFIGSSQLYPHINNIQTAITTICTSSTVDAVSLQTHVKCIPKHTALKPTWDRSMVQPNTMIGDNTFLFNNTNNNQTDNNINNNQTDPIIKFIMTLIDESTPNDTEDLSFMNNLKSLNTTLYEWDSINIPTFDIITNITTWSNTTELVHKSLTYFSGTAANPGNSSNPTLTDALVHGVGSKLPEILIIQDQQYLPLYSEYRNKSLTPALHQILTYAREVEYVLLLPSWAGPDPNMTDLTSKGLSGYNNSRSTLQKGMDDAYHEIEQDLHTWIDAQTYPIDVPGANVHQPQPKPSLSTIPLGPVFEDIMNITWEIPTYNIYNVTSNRTHNYPDGTSIQYEIVTPTMNNTGTTHTVDGVSLLYNQPSGTLTLAGEYVVSLLLFSTMYNRSVTGSIAPNVTVYYDVDELGGPPVDNVPLIIPYITNEAATQIQQIVDTRVNASNFPLLPYKWLSPTSLPTDIPTPTPTASPSSLSSSSSSLSTSSSITPSSSSLSSSSSPSNSSSSTGVASPDQNDQSSSSVEGIKAYWAGIIAGIIAVSILLLYCYRKKQTRDKAGYGPMQFDMEKGYEVELVD